MILKCFFFLQLLERVKMQLASFLEDPQYQDQHSLQTEIIRTFGRVGPNAEPRFRDECKSVSLHFEIFRFVPRDKQQLRELYDSNQGQPCGLYLFCMQFPDFIDLAVKFFFPLFPSIQSKRDFKQRIHVSKFISVHQEPDNFLCPSGKPVFDQSMQSMPAALIGILTGEGHTVRIQQCNREFYRIHTSCVDLSVFLGVFFQPVG